MERRYIFFSVVHFLDSVPNSCRQFPVEPMRTPKVPTGSPEPPLHSPRQTTSSKSRSHKRHGTGHRVCCMAPQQPLWMTPPPSLWLSEAPVREIVLQMHTPARSSQCWSRQTPAWTRSVHLDAPVNGTGNSPSPGQPTPGVVKQDESSGGSVDTTKTRSGPQRVRMSSGERPIGAAKGKRSDTEALCQTPPLPHRT